MSNISTYLQHIASKVYAKDVRTAIVNAISQCYNDVNAPALQTEAMEAAVQAKIDAGEMATLTIADGSLTGAKLADGTITASKLASDVTLETDTTLTQPGMPADAKAVGDAIDGLENAISSVSLSTEVKQALLALLEKVAYVVEDGQDLYDALDLALNPPPGLRSITAAYTQSASVYKNSSLDDLRVDLVVTAHYFDGTTQVVTAYTLSGALKVGTSTITVTYAGKTATFTTTVSVRPLPAAYQRVTYVQSDGNGGVYLRRTIDGRLTGDNSITKYSFEVDAQLLDTQPNYSTNMLIATHNGCWLGYNTSANAIGVGTSSGMTFPGSKTDRHTYTMHITTDGSIVAERDDGARVTRAYTVASGTVQAGLLAIVTSSSSSNYRCAAKVYSYEMYFDGELIRDLVPCYRKSDNVVGLYDMANDYFYTPTGGAFTKGADVT